MVRQPKLLLVKQQSARDEPISNQVCTGRCLLGTFRSCACLSRSFDVSVARRSSSSSKQAPRTVATTVSDWLVVAVKSRAMGTAVNATARMCRSTKSTRLPRRRNCLVTTTRPGRTLCRVGVPLMDLTGLGSWSGTSSAAMRVTIDSLGTCLRRPDGRVDLALCSDSRVSWHGRYLNPPGYTQAKDLLHFELDADSGTLTVQCMRKDNFTSPEPVMVFDDLPTGKPLYVAHTHTHRKDPCGSHPSAHANGTAVTCACRCVATRGGLVCASSTIRVSRQCDARQEWKRSWRRVWVELASQQKEFLHRVLCSMAVLSCHQLTAACLRPCSHH